MRGAEATPEQRLIHDKELMVVQYVFSDEKPAEGVPSVRVGDRNKFTVFDDWRVSFIANIASTRLDFH